MAAMWNPATQATPRIQLYFLGSFEVHSAHQPIHLPTRKIESLLAYVVLHPEAHARENPAALFLSNFSDAKAGNSLRHALSAVRHQLSDRCISYSTQEING